MKQYLLKTYLMVLTLMMSVGTMWAADTYVQLTSIASIDENAKYVLGIDGTGFHKSGTSSWGVCTNSGGGTPLVYKLVKSSDGKSFKASTVISGTTYYLTVPTSNTFTMSTSSTAGNTDMIIGTTQVSGTNYAVANKGTTTRHLRLNGTSGLRSYAGTTGNMAFFYKVVPEGPTVSSIAIKTLPTKTTYMKGEVFDPTGLVITKTMSDATTADVAYSNETKNDFAFDPSLETELSDETSVTITYGKKTAIQNITINPFVPTAGTYNIVPNNVFWGKSAQDGASSVSKNTVFGPVKKFGVSFEMNSGESTNSYMTSDHSRAYNGYTLKLTAPSGFNLTDIEFTGSTWSTPAVNVGTIDEKKWNGEAGEVVFTFSGTSYLSNIKVTYAETSDVPSGDQPIPDFIKTPSVDLTFEENASEYDIRQCLNIPSDYDTSIYNITTTINGLTQDDEGGFACVYPILSFKKVGEYLVHVTASAQSGMYAQTEGDITINVVSAAPKISIAWSVNETVIKVDNYIVSGSSITRPSAPMVEGYKFMGWTLDESVNEDGTGITYLADNATAPENDVTYRAVFAEVQDEESWTEISTATPEDGVYAICSNSYFMKATISSNRFANGEETPQIEDGKLTNAPAADCQWEISKIGLYFYIKNSGKYAVGTTIKNQGALLVNANSDLAKWEILYKSAEKGYDIINYGRSKQTSDPNNKYLRNNNQNGWATYAQTTGTIPRLFKKSETTYCGYTLNAQVAVLQSLEITTPPTKTEYFEGDTFDKSGMVVIAHYDISTNDKEVTDFTVGKTEALATSDAKITISWGGKIVEQAISVSAIELQSIYIAQNPTKMSYKVGESFDPTGMVVRAAYNDERKNKDVDLKEGEMDGYTFLPSGAFTEAGQQTISITYNDKTATVGVSIIELAKHTVTFSVNGMETAIAEVVGEGGVEVPMVSPVGDYIFSGWCKVNVSEETTSKPEYVTITNGTYYPEEDTRLYAVYTTSKSIEKAGSYFYILSGEQKIYIGARSGANTYFTNVSSADDALTIFEENDYLFYVTSTGVKTYFAGLTSGKADLTFATDKSKVEPWTITEDSENGGKTYQSATTNRYLSYNTSAPRFATYATANNFFAENSLDKLSISTPHYTSTPSGVITPAVSFEGSTLTVIADQTVANVLSTNSTGKVTYSSNNIEVASVNEETGEVTGHKFGEATITANIAAVDGQFYAASAEYTISVSRITTAIKFDNFEEREANATVYADNVYTFKASTNAPTDDADVPEIVYSLSSETYATIDSQTGKITFKPATGVWTSDKSVTAYAKVPNSNTRYTSCNSSSTYAKLTISVKDNRKAQTITFPEGSDKSFVKGDTEGTNFSIAATGAKTAVTYSTSNSDLAGVNENSGEVVVNTTTAGTAVITATAAAERVWNVEKDIYETYPEATATYTITVEKSSRPIVSLASGNYDAAQEVTFSCDDAHVFYYTLDGSNPTYDIETMDSHGEEFDPGHAPIIINKDCTLKVIAVNNDLDAVSPIVEANYTFTLPNAPEIAWNEEKDFYMISDNLLINSDEGTTLSYSIDGEEEVLLEGNSANFSFEKYGEHEVKAYAHKDGLTSESTVKICKVYGYADIPYSYNGKGGDSYLPLCFLNNGTSNNEGDNGIAFKDETQSLTLMLHEGASKLQYTYQFNGTWKDDNDFKVETSTDGVNFSVVTGDVNCNIDHTSQQSYTANVTLPVGVGELEGYVRFIRWTYAKNSGNVYIGNIRVLPAGPTLTISGMPIEGEYAGTQIVEASASNAAVFYYTTDGTEPTNENYHGLVDAINGKGLIEIEETCVLRVATAYDDDRTSADTQETITIVEPTELAEQTLCFERGAVQFFTDEQLYIQAYSGQAVLGANTKVTYSSSDSELALVNEETGFVVLDKTKIGTATITATAEAFGNWKKATTSYTITIGKCTAPILEIAGALFDSETIYDNMQFGTLSVDKGQYIAYTIGFKGQEKTAKDGVIESIDDILDPMNGDIYPEKDKLWLAMDEEEMYVRCVTVVPFIRKDAQGISHAEMRAVSDEAQFVIKLSGKFDVVPFVDQYASYADFTEILPGRDVTIDKETMERIVAKTGNPNTMIVVSNTSTLGVGDNAPSNVIVKNEDDDYLCNNFILTDKSDFAPSVEFKATKVAYSRSNTQGNNTVCLPFAISGSEMAELFGVGSVVYALRGVETSDGYTTINFDELGAEDRVDAGTPCIVQCATSESWNIEISDGEGVDIKKDASSKEILPAGDNATPALQGAFLGSMLGTGYYKLNAAGTKFVKTTASSTISPFRFYLALQQEGGLSDVREFGLSFTDKDGHTTGIMPLKSMLEGESQVYDLSGRRMERPTTHGVYIVNGKKVIK